MNNRLMQIWISYRSIPLWVQIWVAGMLVPANALAFALLDTWGGQVAAWAAMFVVATNLPIMWWERGMSKLMSMPHLLAWIPLEVALVQRLAGRVGPVPLTGLEQAFLILLLIVNGISLVFDLMDSLRWLRGDRSIPGQSL